MRSYPPLEGEGRLVWSEAKYETGWGDLSARALFEGRDPHPTPPLISFASTLPLQGRVRKNAPAFSDSDFKQHGLRQLFRSSSPGLTR